MKPTPDRWRLAAALGSIYLIWGSTFLAIRFAIAGIPPMLMSGLRFAVAGMLLGIVARLLGKKTRLDWPPVLVGGIAMIALGNGTVTWSIQQLPSGMAALLVAAVPLWVVLLEWIVLTRRRPEVTTLAGVGLGLTGILVLIGPGLEGIDLGPSAVTAAALVLLGTLGWASGSLYLSYRTGGAALWPLLSRQLLIGGGLLFVWGASNGELARFDPAAVSGAAWLSVLYLVVVGTVIGYSCYIWLLKSAPPALTGTYAFVNPVIALILGAWLAGEQLTPISVLAAVLIVAAVTLVCWPSRPTSGVQVGPMGDPLIARSWEGTVETQRAEEYLRYLKQTGIADYQGADGNRGVLVLTREEGAVTRFTLLSFWESREAIEAFVGPGWERAFYYPEDAEFLLKMEPGVAHHQVRLQPVGKKSC